MARGTAGRARQPDGDHARARLVLRPAPEGAARCSLGAGPGGSVQSRHLRLDGFRTHESMAYNVYGFLHILPNFTEHGQTKITPP